MKEIKCFKCDLCGDVYEKKGECQSCEEYHADYSRLKIIDAVYCNSAEVEKFPQKIIVEISDYSGTLAEYCVSKVDSVEAFEPLTRAIDDDD